MSGWLAGPRTLADTTGARKIDTHFDHPVSLSRFHVPYPPLTISFIYYLTFAWFILRPYFFAINLVFIGL